MAESDTAAVDVPAPALRAANGNISDDFVAAISTVLAAGDSAHLKALAGDLHEADLADLIGALPGDLRPALVEGLGRDFDFAALTELDENVRAELLERLPTELIVAGFRTLESDDAVYLLEDLDAAGRAAILERLPPPERVALTRGLDFPEDSAGRRMQTDFIAVPPFWTVGRTIDYLRDTGDLPDSFYEIFVVDPAYRLIGTLPLDRVLRSGRPVGVGEIVDKEPRKVLATEDQESVARLFARYNLVAAPVVDEHGRLVGVITVDDMVDVLEEETEEDLRALGGVFGDQTLSDSLWYTAKSRFGWLFVNLVTAFVASSVLGFFETEIAQMVALAVLAPIVASQGGNAATQTMTVTVRALATRELRAANALRVVGRELGVGLLNGLAFAIITGAASYVWFHSLDLGYVIGLAMTINLIAGALGGILIPIALNRFKVDPAVASGAFVTTVTDVVGFFSFLGIATLWFGLK